MDDEKAVPPTEFASNQAVLDHTDVEGQVLVTDGVGHRSATTPYERKAMVLNKAMQNLGMGRYQWALFFVIGFGRFVGQVPAVINLILPAVAKEFKFNSPIVKLGQNVGLLIGGVFWGLGSDIWGRKTSFDYTLLITGIFTVAAGGSPSYIALSSLAAAGSFGSGGNLSADPLILLEFVPATQQYLLTVLSIWSAFSQLVGSLVNGIYHLSSSAKLHTIMLVHRLLGHSSQTFLAPRPHPPLLLTLPARAPKIKRYLLYTTGGFALLFWLIRFTCFTMHESPKYLMGKGLLEEVVEVIRKVAQANGRESSLVARDLEITEVVGEEGMDREVEKRAEEVEEAVHAEPAEGVQGKRGPGILADLDCGHVKALFSTRKKAYSMCLLIAIRGLIGLGFSLYSPFLTYFLATRGVKFGDGSTYTTYRNQVIINVIGVTGAIVSGYMVELPILGRRGTLSLFTALSGVFILTSTTSRTSNALLGWNCAYSFTSTIMYGVLSAITPELLPTKDRGTGNALTEAANKFFGVTCVHNLSGLGTYGAEDL